LDKKVKASRKKQRNLSEDDRGIDTDDLEQEWARLTRAPVTASAVHRRSTLRTGTTTKSSRISDRASSSDIEIIGVLQPFIIYLLITDHLATL